VAPEVHALLRSMEVKWTSLGIVRIGVIGGSATPLILWIGMKPKSFTCDDGLVVAWRVQDLLKRHHRH